MAVQFGGANKVSISLAAGGDLSAKQYHFVKLSGSTVVICAAVTDIPIGVLQNAPESGELAEVIVAGPTKVSCDADLAANSLIGTSADGQAAAYVAGTDTTKYVVGRVIGDPGAAAEIASAIVDCSAPGRGA